MTISRIGSLIESADAERIYNDGTESITVPADAEIMIVGVSGYDVANYFAFMTIGGAAMTKVAADSNTSMFMGALFYKVSPPTGTQTLAWDWSGTGDPANGVIIIYGFYKGIDIAGTPVGTTNGVQDSASPVTSGILTCASGDLVVAWGFLWWDAALTFTESMSAGSITEIGEYDCISGYRAACGVWAEGIPTGNTTVTVTATRANDGGICCIVLKSAAAGGPAGVKTVQGLAKASVKTVQGLAIASVKSLQGLP